MRNILFIALVCMILAWPAFGEEAIGTYTFVEGRVDVMHEAAEAARRVKVSDPVYLGDIVRTKTNSKTEITFRDQSVLRLAPGARVEIEKYILDEANRRNEATVKLFRGKIRATVSKNGDEANFHIETPNAKGLVKGTDIFASYEADTTSVLVTEGKMSIFNPAHPDEVTEIGKGDYVTVPIDKAPQDKRGYLEAERDVHDKDTSPAFSPRPGAKEEELAIMRGKIIFSSGEARIYKTEENKWRAAKVDDVLAEGDKVETGANGRLKVILENGNALVLHENSEILVKKLRQDPKTGEYENLFESDYGKIKAIVEKLGKKSTFRIKTPTAVCGVRGTVMYLDIAGSQTSAFYEGGAGEVTSLISGATQIIDAGQNSIADTTGNITPPALTTGEQRMKLDEMWEAKESVDNYTKTEEKSSGESMRKSQSDPTREGKSDLHHGRMDNLEKNAKLAAKLEDRLRILSEVPFQEKISSALPKEAIAFTGHFVQLVAARDNGIDFNMDRSSSIKGDFNFSIPGAGSRWGGVSRSGNSISGTYFFGESSYKIWGIDINTDDFVYSASDGGKMGGFIGGTLINGHFTGKAFGMFVDALGYGGTYSSLFRGTASGGTFRNVGDITVNFTSRGKVEFTSGEMRTRSTQEGDILDGKGSGRFTGAASALGTISATGADGHHINFTGEHWGIWALAAKGDYISNTTDEWKLAIGGAVTGPGSSAASDAWLGTADGNKWSDGAMSASFEGFWFSESSTTGRVNGGRIFNGDLIGYYNDEVFTWNALGGGEWMEVTDLLREAQMGFTISEFENFVTVPITEAYSSIMTASNSTFTDVTMNINFYQNALNNIWAGSVSGAHSGDAGNNWTLALSNDSGHSVTLTGDKWDGGRWHASVAGSMPSDNVTFSGEAAGTYNANTFDGVGGGKWQEGNSTTP